MLSRLIDAKEARRPLPLFAIASEALAAWRAGLTDAQRQWAESQGFGARAGQVLCLPGPDGAPAAAVVGLGNGDDPSVFASAATTLPPGDYRLASEAPPPGRPAHPWDGGAGLGRLSGGAREGTGLGLAAWAQDVCLAWALAAYRFDRYRPVGAEPSAAPEGSRSGGSDAEGDGGDSAGDRSRAPRRLVWPVAADRARIGRLLASIALVRDLINTPAGDMGPAELADAAATLATAHGARLTVTRGEGLLRAGFPLIHAVGRASPREPRLIDLTWGDPSAPKVTLVGKGVCFDTGGLDIKTSGAMRLMKKDMGGAAHVLGIAAAVMAQRLALRLRVLIPAVDNAISGDALRPGDILTSRKGLSVEIGNTDAEGRLVLADALAEATSEHPDLVIDCATLTGAARVALGPEVPALFTDDEPLAQSLLAASARERDPLWRLPLWTPYRAMLDSPVADLTNAPAGSFAGAITAALFLKAFVDPGVSWAHLDLFGWAPKARPGQPEGAAVQGLRAILAVLEDRADA